MTLNPFRASFRTQFLLGFAACVALMAYALYAEHVLGLEPCPLCIFQRIAVMSLGVVFLIGGLVGPKRPGGRRAWGVLALIPALAGIGVAGRHVWIQHLPPDQIPSCGPPFAFLRETLPFIKLIRKVLTGDGQCAKIEWTFLGQSMPVWTLVCLVVLALWIAFAAFRRR
ncbi:disulfide bond formation protein B [Lysobacter sp. TY2-98]|uniref:disulfide bond formation protein B n=1 Tax=Lysobacter sp. TY2-98 TaxID=2290922 RepID=UPI000E208A7F|nr:disulfide bond formation protein B [Lysobacter sp. TY2-98]AXK72518.1 disulfide bond formation protein B [Lysobacter sp. TY2-98]